MCKTLTNKIELEESKLKEDNKNRLVKFLEDNLGKLLNVEFFGLSFIENMGWHYANKNQKTIIIENEEEEGTGTLEISLENIENAEEEFCTDILNVTFLNVQGENLRMYCN